MAPSKADKVEAYRALTAAQRDRTKAVVGGVWLRMTSWSDAAKDDMLAQVVPVVLGAQQATASATSAFLQSYMGQAVDIDTSQLVGAALRNGVDPVDVYARAVTEARAVYSRSKLVDLAVNAGMTQLMGTVDTDLQLTATHTSQQVMGAAGVKVYRRATRPGACPLCVADSDRVYHVAQLLPLHRGCHCVPVPGSKLPPELRRDSNDVDPAGGRGLEISDNGEIGPVLDYADRVSGKKRPTGSGTTADTITDAERVAMKRAQLKSYEKVIADGGGTPWMLEKVKQLRSELGVAEPLTLAQKVGVLRDEYRAIDGDWGKRQRRYSDAALADGNALLDKRQAEIEAQLPGAIEAGLKDGTNWRADVLESQLMQVERDRRALNAPGKIIGPSEAAAARLDKVMQAGDELLKDVRRRVDLKVASATELSPAELATQKKLKDAADSLTRKYEAHRRRVKENAERAYLRDAIGREITMDEYWELPDPPKLTPDQFQGVLDRTQYVTLMNKNLRLAKAEMNAAHRALKAFEDAVADRSDIAWRNAVTEVLAEVRQMGGTGGTTFVAPKTGKPLAKGVVKEALEAAQQSYPAEWLAAQRAKFPALKAKKVKRGYFSSGRGEIALSGDTTSRIATIDPDGLLDVATHEIGHSMEYAIPDISRLEWMFLRRRIVGPDGKLLPRTKIYRGEYGYKDNFTNHYTGKTYGGGQLESPENAYELFTTGVQGMFTGGRRRFMMGADGATLDEDFLKFMLGVMSVV